LSISAGGATTEKTSSKENNVKTSQLHSRSRFRLLYIFSYFLRRPDVGCRQFCSGSLLALPLGGNAIRSNLPRFGAAESSKAQKTETIKLMQHAKAQPPKKFSGELNPVLADLAS
jgi:hypothetical protein